MPDRGSRRDQRPRSDLSQEEGRGEPGSRQFRTICLRVASGFLPSSAQHLLTRLLLGHADPDGGNCFPSLKTIREGLERAPGWSSKQKVEGTLSLLRDLGWVEAIPFTENGHPSANLYRLRIPADLPGDVKERGMEGALNWQGRRPGQEPRERAE
jgi:hypothetical protein